MLKHVKYYNSVASATGDSALVSPIAALVTDGTNEQVLISEPSNNVGLEIVGSVIGDLKIQKKQSGQTYSDVDLGLDSGTKWMTCNLGATHPYEFGDYYAWGETEPYYDNITWDGSILTSVVWKRGKSDGYKDDFTNYKHYKEGSIIKYNENDGSTTLINSDDAIYVATNGKYKIPTTAQVQELVAKINELGIGNCWTDNYQGTGIAGITITGNGNTLFIPASGYFSGASVVSVCDNCNVWSSDIVADANYYAYRLYFNLYGVSNDSDIRCYGFALRGVLI